MTSLPGIKQLIPSSIVPSNIVPSNIVPGNTVPGNIVPGSDTCVSLTLDEYTSISQMNLHSSTTGHNLKLGQMYIIDSQPRQILLEAIQEFRSQLKDVPLTPGGFGMDMARIAQWLLPQPKTVAFLGARASDEDSVILKELCRQTRVGVRMEEVANCRTAVLLVLHYKRKWSEIFFIDNIATISPSFFDKPAVTTMLERTNMVYITELCVVLNPKVAQMLAYYSFSRFKHCLLILHREQYLLQTKEIIQEILNYVDIIFLTPRCAAKMIAVYDIPQKYRCCNGSRNAWDIYMWLKVLAKKLSIVIVSDGIGVAYVHTDLNTGMSARYKSKFCRRSKAVDYYGTARAFAAGFMAMMIRGYQLDPCVECGFYCASVIVRKIGVQLPDDESAMNEWYLLLDRILQRKGADQPIQRRQSSMPFTMFQTPWKEGDLSAVFGVCISMFDEGSVSLTC